MEERMLKFFAYDPLASRSLRRLTVRSGPAGTSATTCWASSAKGRETPFRFSRRWLLGQPERAATSPQIRSDVGLRRLLGAAQSVHAVSAMRPADRGVLRLKELA